MGARGTGKRLLLCPTLHRRTARVTTEVTILISLFIFLHLKYSHGEIQPTEWFRPN